MSAYLFPPDGTSKSIEFKVVKASDGTPRTELAYDTSGLTCYWSWPRSTSNSITLATLAAPDSVWSSGGFKEKDATYEPGVYRFDVPNAVLASATGKEDVSITFRGASDMDPVTVHIKLVAIFDPDNDGINLAKIAGSTVAVDALKALLESGTIDQVQDASPRTATQFCGSSSLSSDDDFYNNNLLIFLTGTLAKQRADVDDYAGSNRQITLKAAATEIPAVGTYFILA